MRERADEIAGRHVDEYSAGMIEHDMHIGQFLDKLDELGIEDNTIVFYSTDNGPHMNTWPDAAMTPFWGEKNTQWEGAWRVPAMVRWPGHIAEGAVNNEVVHHMDWLPTFLAAAGNETVKEDLLEGITVEEMGRDYRVHLDGYDILPMLTGETDESPRHEIFYFTDDGDLAALRYDDWKITFLEQTAWGTFRAWMEPLTPLRVPLITNLRRDPYERAYRTSNTYYDWMLDRAYLLVPAQRYVGQLPVDLPGVPAAAGSGELQPRQGDGAAEQSRRRAVAALAKRERYRLSAGAARFCCQRGHLRWRMNDRTPIDSRRRRSCHARRDNLH